MFSQRKFPISPIAVGDWTMQTTSTTYALDETLLKQLQAWVEEWADLPMHNEATWVQQNHRVPTLIARFDLHPDGQVIELEVRPQGAGTASLLNPLFAKRFSEIREGWPHFNSVQTGAHASHGCDDHLWLTRHALGDEPSDGLLLVRNMTGEPFANHLALRAIAPVANEGDKSYGTALGWWKMVTSPEALPWNESFVVKPLAGAKSHDVGIWVPSTSGNRPRGAYTRSKIINLLRDRGQMWLQPFYQPPLVETEQGPRYLMLRPFFGYDIPTTQWHYLGGTYVLGDTLRIHGTVASIFGPLV